MKKLLKKILVLTGVLALALVLALPAFAASAPIEPADGNGPDNQAVVQEDSTIGQKAIAAGIAVGIAAAAGALSMGLVTSKSTEGISRQPEAEGKIRSAMMLGLVFIETAIIYALLVVILIIFVL